MPESKGEASWLPHVRPVLLILDGYIVSTFSRDLLTKNINFYFWFSSSLNKATLTKTFDTAR